MINHIPILQYLIVGGKETRRFHDRRQYGRQILVILFFLLAVPRSFAQDDTISRILVLFSYHSGFPSYNDQISGIASVFPAEDYRLDFEFLDSKRFPDGLVREKINSALIEKMGCRDAENYDCILVADDNALRFILDHSQGVCSEIPIFFFGVNNRRFAYEQDANPRVTGIVEDVSIKENLSLIRTLFPEAFLRVVTDGTISGQGDLQALREIASVSGDYRYLNILDLSLLSWEELDLELKRHGGDPILLLSAYSDRTGARKSFEQSLSAIIASSAGPVFHLWTHGLGDGIAGGILVSQYEQARAAALLADGYLGNPLSPLPPVVRESPNLPIFDYNVLRMWDIPFGYLPSSSRIISRPLAFMEDMKNHVILLSVFIILLLLAIALLVYLLDRARRAESTAVRSVRKWQTYISRSPLGILVCDKDGHVLESNPAALSLLGLDESNLSGRNIKDVFAGRYGDPGDMIALDYDDPEGVRKSLAIESSDVEDDNRLIIIRDITEQQKYLSQKELRQKELQAVIDLMPAMIFMKDREGTFLMANRACAENMGRPVKEIIGRNHRALHAQTAELETMLEEDRKVIDSGEPLTIWDEPFTLPSGDVIRLDVVKLPFRSFDSGETVMLGMAQDVSDKYSLQEGIMRTERLRSLGVLAGGVAHDFNNQLMGILGYLELAGKEDLPERAVTYLDGVRTAANRASDLVQNLLGFSREKPKNLMPADVHSLLKEVVSLVQASSRRGILYLSEFNALQSVIPCDAGMVENALFHVVLNAAQAIRGEGEVRIITRDVAYEDLPLEKLADEVPEGTFLLVQVEDNGVGIDEKIRDRILEPFFTTKADAGGTGIGLALAYGTVKNHHGIVQVESLPGEGTKVRIYLPVRM